MGTNNNASSQVIIVDKDTFKRFNSLRNKATKNHDRSNSTFLNKIMDTFENRGKEIIESIEEEDHPIGFPSL